MRVIYRILYAIAAAIGLYLVFDISNASVVNAYIETHGTQAIEDENYEYFISARYYHQVPVFETTVQESNRTFVVKIYNVGNIRTIENEFDVVEGFYVLMHQTAGPEVFMPYYASVTGGTIINEYTGIKISVLPIYTLVQSERFSMFMNYEDFVDETEGYQNITEIEVIQSEITLFTLNVNLELDDLVLEQPLLDYIDTYQEVPTEAFDQIGYAPVIQIDSRFVVIRNVIIYLILVSIITFFIFFKQRKRMGRTEATTGLEKDIERLKKTKEEKR
jgi:hypothetical protein